MITIRQRPVCPMCREYGVHGTADGCLDALRSARELFDQVSRANCQKALADRERALRSVTRYLDYTKSVGMSA